jgi:uncharacterized protein YdcH (DUF465 family)
MDFETKTDKIVQSLEARFDYLYDVVNRMNDKIARMEAKIEQLFMKFHDDATERSRAKGEKEYNTE